MFPPYQLIPLRTFTHSRHGAGDGQTLSRSKTDSHSASPIDMLLATVPIPAYLGGAACSQAETDQPGLTDRTHNDVASHVLPAVRLSRGIGLRCMVWIGIEIRLFDALQGILCEPCLLRWESFQEPTARNILLGMHRTKGNRCTETRRFEEARGFSLVGATPFHSATGDGFLWACRFSLAARPHLK